MMKPGEIRVNGFSSDKLNIRCQSRPDLKVPQRKIKTFQVMSGNGDLILDEGAYENTPLSLKLACKGMSDDDVVENRMKCDSLFIQGQYNEVEFWFDEGVIYHCYVTESAELINKSYYDGIIIFNMELSAKPWKSFKTREQDKIVHTQSGGRITNPTKYSAKPLIKINGNGSITFKLNLEMRFVNVDGHIFIDSEEFFCYKNSLNILENRNDRTDSLYFPIIMPENPNNKKPDFNKIIWSGNVTSVEIWPRWRKLV